MLKSFESFVNESSSNGPSWPQDLALITVKYFVQERRPLARDFYLSRDERSKISAEYGKKLPKGFPGPETNESIGPLIACALYENPSWSEVPYWDDADLVFGDWPLVFKSKVSSVGNRGFGNLSSTWEDLGEWLKENMDSLENNIKLWLESDLKWSQFTEKYRGKFTGRKFGL
jgi:hypothetical protein